MVLLFTVKHSDAGHSDACAAATQHRDIGVEKETVEAIKVWVLTGKAEDVVDP